jgi:hypothetical protein
MFWVIILVILKWDIMQGPRVYIYGHGQKHLKEFIVKPNLIAKNIYEAALLIDKGEG